MNEIVLKMNKNECDEVVMGGNIILTGNIFVFPESGDNASNVLFEDGRETHRHGVDARLLVRVVVLGILEDEPHVFGKVHGRLVVAHLQLFSQRLQVHGVIDHLEVVGHVQDADGFAERRRIFRLAQRFHQVLALLFPAQRCRSGYP